MKVYKKIWFPVIPQIITLIVFGLLVYGGIGIITEDKNLTNIIRNTNLSNLIVWSYWWPLIIVAAIIFGRHWCTICPMELVTSLASKFGLKKKPTKTLKSGWIITLFYIIILIIGIQTLAIHRVPNNMAIYMFILFLIAVIAGFIWEKRTFCTYICPVGHLLGMYSLIAITEWRVKSKNTCNECKTKDCIDAKSHYKLIGRSCTSNLYPASITDNRICILCSQCDKSCPNSNVKLGFRKPMSDLLSNVKLSSAELAFVVIVSGFVVYEILAEWKTSKSILLYFPGYVNGIFGITGSTAGTIKAVVLFVIFPFIFFSIFSVLRRIGSKEALKDSILSLGLAILPVMASMHLLKAIFKTTSRIPYWQYAFNDPKGLDTASSILNTSLKLDNSIVGPLYPYVSGLAMLLSIAGLFFSFVIIRKRQNETKYQKAITLLAVLLYFGIFATTIVNWRFM